MRHIAATLLLLALAWPCVGLAESHPPAQARKGMVAADNATASAEGARVLAEGGDAVDAAITTALVLGVVHPFASGLGGGGFAVVHRRTADAFALDFREVAPGKATANMYLDANGEVIEGASRIGPRAAGVPGELAGLWALHKAHGKLPWARLVAPALRLARDGFPMHALLHSRLSRSLAQVAKSPDLAASFLDATGQPLPLGATVKRPALARTLALLQAKGADPLYRGDVGQRLAAAMAKDGGLITQADLAAYQVKRRPLIALDWRGYRVLSMPPPSSGGAVLAQVLKVLEPVDLKALGHNSSAYLHRLSEALKHAFADRARIMGDPDFTPVPVDELLSPDAIARVQAAFRPDATLAREAYGQPFTLPKDGGTTHFSVVDAEGNAVALTSTINTGFGSYYVAGDTGLLLNDEMDDFVAKPGVPNAFGLIGREANAIAPGKRPLSSMTPTVVLKDGVPVLVVGGSGGPTIITGTVQVLLNVLAFDMPVRAAVEAPRIHHQWVPERVMVERDLPVDVVDALKRRGHTVERWDRYNAVQAVGRDGLWLTGASDPSKLGQPAGVD
ncbi:MAG: gamma-glutamyltransferase [Myxococcales bacterium]|nr:gamma-glutamyltransferase [Myxococcales bacterium]